MALSVRSLPDAEVPPAARAGALDGAFAWDEPGHGAILVLTATERFEETHGEEGQYTKKLLREPTVTLLRDGVVSRSETRRFECMVQVSGQDTEISEGVARFRGPVTATDLDGDGLVEITFSYLAGCRREAWPLTHESCLWEGEDAWCLSGETRVRRPGRPTAGGQIGETRFEGAPPAFLEHVSAQWRAGVADPMWGEVEETLDEALLTGETWDPLESTCRHASLSIL